MTYGSIPPRHLTTILLILALAFIAPAAAQGTVPQAVQPGERIEVGSEPLVLDLVNLRNADTFNAVTELRKFRNDNPNAQITQIVPVPNDGYFKINVRTIDGNYGRYFAFSKTDGLLQQNSITFVPAPEPTATGIETVTAVTETPLVTQTTATTPEPTTAPLPTLIAIAAIGICALFGAMQRE
ncbi:MAG: hypothetical protein GX837_02630 [Methanomicrobiales archaeon]|nr:hypothetical protein [Methanomicrobiales archaeon]